MDGVGKECVPWGQPFWVRPQKLETVCALASASYKQLLEVLERRYQSADQVALYRTQLQTKQKGLKETLGDFGDVVRWSGW